MSAKKKLRKIREVLVWSSKCHEHFLPWRSKTAEPIRSGDIAEAGISDTCPGYELGRENPRFHLLVYPTHGQGQYYSETKQGRVKQGEVLIVPEGLPFGYKPYRQRWRFMWFHLPPIERWSGLAIHGMRVRRTLITNSMQRAMEGFLQECRGRGATSQRAAALYGELISIYVERDLGHGASDTGDELHNQIALLWELVDANLKHPWTVDELASHIGVSRAHLHRLCQEHAEISPMKMVTRLRMERAQELLIMDDYPVRIISEMVGYQDEFAFAVAFKRFSGVTPGQFRQRR